METEGDPPVSTGPPPEPPPAARQTDGSIAVTGAPAPAPGLSAPCGAETPGETPQKATTDASGPMDVEMPPAPAASRPTLNQQPAQGSTQTPPESMDVFAETNTSAEPDSPVSRRYHEDGDAAMEGEKSDALPTKPFKSELQTQAQTGTTTNTGRRTSKTMPSARSSGATPKAPARQRQAGAKANDSSTTPRRQVAQQTGQKTPTAPVWSKQGAAQLRASLGGKAEAASGTPPAVSTRDVDPALSAYYACATRAANLRFDGDQRTMTELEAMTLFKWMDRQIYLPEPPLFLTETHTSAEQDVIADFDRDHLGYRLYGILPAGTTLSEGNAKYHFCYTALLANARDPAMRASLESMFLAAQVIASVPKSKIVILRFVHPEERDAWQGLTFKLGAGSVTLVATDSLTTDIPRVGMDDGARDLLYHVYARGHSQLKRSMVRAVMTAAAKLGVFDVKSIESQGLADFSSQKWKITFAQVTCPPALVHVRRVEADCDGETLIFDLQHPRAARRAPCTKCLSIRHVTTACTSKDVSQSLRRHTLKLAVQAPPVLPKLTAADKPATLRQQLRQLRQLAAPDLAARLKQEHKDRLDAVKAQAKKDANRAAREAAEEARALRAIKRQATEDRNARQLRASRVARREVTSQLMELQALARREALGIANAKLNQQSTASGQRNPVPHSPVADRPQGEDCPANSTSDESHTDQEANTESDADALSAESDSGESADSATSNAPDSSRAERMSSDSCDSSSEGADASATPERDAESGDPGTDVGTASAVSHASTSGGVVEDASGDAEVQDAEDAAEQCETGGESQDDHAAAECSTREDVETPRPIGDGPHEDTAFDEATHRDEHGEGTGNEGQAGALILATPSHASPAPVIGADGDAQAATGKRTTPPSPSSSDDEEKRRAKWAHTSPSAPFPATFSPVEVAESLTKLIRDAVQKSSEQMSLAPPSPANRRTTRTEAPPKRRQLALSEFYAPESLADAQARLEQEFNARAPGAEEYWIEVFPSPVLDALLHDVRSPATIEAWCEALQVRIISVPGNGGCFYYALHCCRTGQKLVGRNLTVQSYHTVEANHYKDAVCTKLLVYLDQMLSDGTVTLEDLRSRYFGVTKTCGTRAERRKAIKAIRTFVGDIQGVNLAAKDLERAQWAGEAEVFAAVWYIHEPIFIVSQLTTSSTTVRVIWLERTDPQGPERIVQLFPDAGEAYEFLRSFLCQRVLPVVMVHTTAGGGHYNTLRFHEDLYKAWTADDRTGEAMRARMNPVLARLGWYVAPRKATGIPTTTIVRVDSSGSEYEPSHPSLLSAAVFQLSPNAPLPPPAHYGLLSALNPKGRRRGALAALWDQAERLNFQAYRTWDDAQPCSEPWSEPDSVEAGCVHWSASIPQLVALLRALPYPEVAMCLMRPDILVRLGNELNDLATDGTVPDFVRAEDPVDARRQWARLVALVAVVSNDDLIDLRSVEWLRQHPRDTVASLHALRLHNWTVISTLVNASNAPLPIRSSAAVPAGSDRL